MSTSSAPSMSAAAVTRNASKLTDALAAADGAVVQGIQGLQRIHQARLSQANRTLAVLTAQYGPNDPQVTAAQAAIAAMNTTIGRLSMVGQQLTVPAVQVSPTGWALQGVVRDAQLNPAAKFTVFLVDEEKTFLQTYGFAYTDATGYFLINYEGPAEAADKAAAAAPLLFIEVADTDANPVYLSSTPFEPQLGVASYQPIVLPAGTQPIGDPPAAIRAVALPVKAKSSAKSRRAKGKGKGK
jgi:hypothetical protein